MAIPDHHKLITEAHVQATLKADKGDKALLSSWSVEDFTHKGDNFITAVTSVKVLYTVKGKIETVCYISKINPNLGADDFRPFPIALFRKEAQFYKDIAPALNAELAALGLDALGTPQWYHSSLEEGQELLFLEDLRSRGYKMCDRKKGLDAQHTHLVVKELARWHAASCLLQERYPNEDLTEKYSTLGIDWHNYSDRAENNMNNLLSPIMEDSAAMLKRIGGYEQAVKWLENAKSTSFQIFQRHIVREAPFAVICHGDCYNNNLLFRYNDQGDPVDVMMLDLQVSRLVSAATDLNCLMFTSLTGDIRRSNEAAFLTTYYDSFSSVMQLAGRPMPFDSQQLLQEYRDRHEWGLLFSVLTVFFIVRPSEDIPDVINIKRDDENAAQEWKRATFKMMESNPLFKPRFLAIFDEMLDNGVFD